MGKTGEGDEMSDKNENKFYVECPFCGETDFDLSGLKTHLNYWCEKFQETESRVPVFFGAPE